MNATRSHCNRKPRPLALTLFCLGIVLAAGILLSGCIPVPAAPAATPAATPAITEAEARQIAEQSTCTAEGTIGATEGFNPNSSTWWFTLNAAKAGCSPACVVSAIDKTAEINWRCTGAISPTPTPNG